MKRLMLILSLVAVMGGVCVGDEKSLKEATLEELDEITGGGLLDDKIRLWDEAPNGRNDINIRLKTEKDGSGVRYLFEIKHNEVSMK